MEDLHVREDGGDPLLQLAGERDFGNEIQDVFPGQERLPGQFQVDLRLARTGDPFQQGGLSQGEGVADGLRGRLLGRGEFQVFPERQSFLPLQTLLKGAQGIGIPLPGVVPPGLVHLGAEDFHPAFQPFLFPCLDGLLFPFQGRIGGLVHFADGTQVVRGDRFPETDLLRQDTGKPFFDGKNRQDPVHSGLRRDIDGADRSDIFLVGEQDADAAAHLRPHPFGEAVAGIPLQPEGKDDLYVGRSVHGDASSSSRGGGLSLQIYRFLS